MTSLVRRNCHLLILAGLSIAGCSHEPRLYDVSGSVTFDGQPIPYAFTLVIDEYRGWKRISPNGAPAGHRASFTFFPDRDLAVIILSNLASFPPGKAMAVADLYEIHGCC